MFPFVMKALGRVKSGMQHPSYGGRYKRPCFHSDEGTWEGEVEGEAIHMEGGNIPLLWRGSQPSVDSPLHNMGGPAAPCFIMLPSSSLSPPQGFI